MYYATPDLTMFSKGILTAKSKTATTSFRPSTDTCTRSDGHGICPGGAIHTFPWGLGCSIYCRSNPFGHSLGNNTLE
jgi:hypothetical protein